MSKPSKYQVNESFFHTIDTEEKAYWLGFLAADGHINKKGRALYFNLKAADWEHLVRFKSAIGSDHPIRTRSKTIGSKTFFNKRIIISNKCFVENLINQGIPKGAKTLILRKPKIDLNLERPWIRGYFDGDGSLSKNTRKPNFIFGIIGTLSICQFVRDYFNKICKLELDNIYHRKNHPSEIFKLQVRGNNQVFKILEELYQEATVFLPRKKRVFEDLIQLRKTYSDASNRRYNRIS